MEISYMHNTSLNIDHILIKNFFDTDDIKQLITSCNYEPLYDKPHSPDLIQLAAYDTTSPDNGLAGFISCIVPEFLYDSGDDEGSDCVNNNENNTNEIAETHTKYEIEITAIIKPEYRQNGIFTKLFAALRQLIDNECVINNIYTPVITYIAANPRKQKDNTQSPDMTYAYSDYLMSITPDKICPIHSNTVLNETSDKVSVKVSDKFSSKVFNENSDKTFNNISVSYEVDSDEEVFELIDTDNDTLISSVSYYSSGNSICLYDVWTNPDYRRNGCAGYLLSYMMKELSSNDLSIRSFILHVSGRNTAAVNLYNSIGFAVEQEIKYYRLI